MRILIALTYYRPHVSGLTIYVERLATALAGRGHAVTVLTSAYAPGLPRQETWGGVRIVRVPVAARVSKGVLMPTLGLQATRLARDHDVLSLHLPQFDVAGIALRGRVMGKPTILTYHCDLKLPGGPFNRIVDRVVYVVNDLAARLADKIVTYTQDYASHSPLLSRFPEKLVVIPPPVVMSVPSIEQVAAFDQAHRVQGGPMIGFAARFAAEKGVEHLIDAMPSLTARFPTLKVLFAGPYGDVVGEHAYWARLRPAIDALGADWEFLGTLAPSEMPAFFAACDAVVVPSLNSTESFGLVQVEAMLCGTPVVASDLPGVRQPVRMTGMGRIVPPGNAAALAEAAIDVLERRDAFVRPRTEIESRFDLGATVRSYEALFEAELARSRRSRPVPGPVR
ncbi:MAG: glycosyltransferase [Chloroflexi bacterium]|nr:glycosyltransferase [Chloroflexota bacterium]